MEENMIDFTEEHYRSILQKSTDLYSFITYDKIKDYESKKEYILWRHDVDFSPQRALQLAKIEKEFGVKSTFFLMLGSEHYNLFEEEIKNLINQIIDLGHKIGLHFDMSAYNIKSENELENFLVFEKNIIDQLFHLDIDVFSFHDPSDLVNSFKEFYYSGMINTYGKFFKEEVQYCSDSNGYWRFKTIDEFLFSNEKGNKQVLTHPIWWQKDVMTPREKVTRCIEGRSQKRHDIYDKKLEMLGRGNIG